MTAASSSLEQAQYQIKNQQKTSSEQQTTENTCKIFFQIQVELQTCQ